MGNEIGWDFTVDSELQLELSNKMKERAEQFDTQITKLYGQIDSMGSNKYWVGEDYDAFKTGCEGYKGALNDLSDSFRMFADHLVKTSEGTTTYADEINDIIANMTSRHLGNNEGIVKTETTNFDNAATAGAMLAFETATGANNSNN